MKLLNEIRDLGVTIEPAGKELRLSYPGKVPPAEIGPLIRLLKKRKVEALAHLRARWSEESAECERKFRPGAPRLYPYLRKAIWTLRGTGILIQVGTEKVAVILDHEPDKAVYLDFLDVLPPSAGDVDLTSATVDAELSTQ